MESPKLPAKTITSIEGMVDLYSTRRLEFVNLAKRIESDLAEHAELQPFIHSTKRREKDPKHLLEKLTRKAREAAVAGKPFSISKKNLFERVGDLAGVRLLHIHADQLAVIHQTIIKILGFYKYKLREKPLVYIWDVERQEFLSSLGLDVKVRPNMYTSVHYVVEPHWDKIACEIQVRTLAEELWGEVSHKVNYPTETESISCRGQLAALARMASGCTRLVDSIFASMAEYESKRTGK